VLRLLDEVRAVPRLDDAIDLRAVVAGQDHETVRGAHTLVVRKRERDRLRAVAAAAFTEELVWIARGAGDFGNPFVHLAQEHLVSNELFG
jgi:hypothetical protein